MPAWAIGQVVTTDPGLPRTDQPVTITFHADEGTQGLQGFDGDVYAHTGISTTSSGEGNWTCVKNYWPTESAFSGNRNDTRLTQAGPDTYTLDIADIRSFYQDRSRSDECLLDAEDEILTMNMVFRSADGSREAKAAGGEDIFIDVADVADGSSSVQVSITAPQFEPLYPFITQNESVDVSVEAVTAHVTSITTLEVLVNGTAQASTTTDQLDATLTLGSEGRYRIQAAAEVETDNGVLRDTAETVFIRRPAPETQPLPSGIQEGINYNADGSVTLSLYAPNKEFVYVLGDVNGWTVDNSYLMNSTADGHWWITLPAAEIQSGTEYAFQYFVDGALRIADPFSYKVLTPNDRFISESTYPNLKPYPDSLTENRVSVFETGQEAFDFSPFTPPPQDEMVVYELLLRDFVEESTFETLADSLDYLDRLGINAIELMPVSEFAGNNSWGYNPTFHFALDKAYGTRESFKRFVEAAHSRGIAVILDVVYNHIDTQSPLVQLYGTTGNPFIEEPQDCGPFEELNQGSSFIREDYIARANRYWVEEYNVDGFRFDLAQCVASPNDWKGLADDLWDRTDPDPYMILEYFGSGLDQLANDGLIPWYKLNPNYLESSMGYVANTTGTPSTLEPAYFGFAGFTSPNIMAYMESHDEQWLMHKTAQFGNAGDNGYDTKELQTALDRQKLSAAFFFTIPGPRMTWQFAELGYGYATDECLNEDDNSDSCGPEAPGRTAPKPIRWTYRDPQQSPGRVDLYRTWQAILRLRNDHAVFRTPRSTTNDAEGIRMTAGDGDVIRCIRLEDEEFDATIVGNFGVTPLQATLGVANDTACSFTGPGTWYNFFEDRALEVGGEHTAQLRPGEFRIYTSQELAPPPMGLVPSAPRVRASATVSSASSDYDFGATGVDIRFSGTSNSGTSNSGTVTVETLDEPPLDVASIGETNVSDYRFVVTSTGDLDVGDQTQIRFDVSTLAGVANANNVTVYRRATEDRGALQSVDTFYDEDTNELVATTGAFGEFVLASDTEGLPVELAGLRAQITGAQTVQLTWRTASETNNAGFRVQRRTDASSWTDLGFVEGAGTTTDARAYRFADAAVPFAADSVRYRLEQVDVDGRTERSETVSVHLGAPDRVQLMAPYPNPTRERATVRYAVPSRHDVQLDLFDVLGRKVRTLVHEPQEGRQQQHVDVSSLASGVYFLRLQAAGGVWTRKLTVVE